MKAFSKMEWGITPNNQIVAYLWHGQKIEGWGAYCVMAKNIVLKQFPWISIDIDGVRPITIYAPIDLESYKAIEMFVKLMNENFCKISQCLDELVKHINNGDI